MIVFTLSFAHFLGNLLWTEYGHSVYRDQQSLVLQELPEKAPTGLLPRALDVFVEHDLVDSCKVFIFQNGFTRMFSILMSTYHSLVMRFKLLAFFVVFLQRKETLLLLNSGICYSYN